MYKFKTRDMSNNVETFQSAAKPYCYDMEGSEAIPKGSTQYDSLSIDDEYCGSATPLTHSGEGDEIVRNKYFIKFIEDANKKFNNKFDYSKFEYTKSKGEGVIICPIHGEYLQSPMNHLRSVHGCPKCALENEDRWTNYSKTKKGVSCPQKYLTKDECMKRLIEKYGDTFIFNLELNEWVGGNTIINVFCQKHGWFEKQVHTLLLSNCNYGCNKCANDARINKKTQDKEKVFSELRRVWNNKYIYTQETIDGYINKRTPISIICPEHGVFYKTVQKHMSQGCPKCTFVRLKESDLLPGGYCEELFLEKPEFKNKNAFLYYLKINDGQYYKIGITIVNAKSRIKGLISKAKQFGINLDIEIICEKNMSLYEAFQKEQYILKTYNQYRDFHQNWSTEIFKIDIFDFIKDMFVEHIPIHTKQETH